LIKHSVKNESAGEISANQRIRLVQRAIGHSLNMRPTAFLLLTPKVIIWMQTQTSVTC